jgi:hypothetical protein
MASAVPGSLAKSALILSLAIPIKRRRHDPNAWFHWRTQFWQNEAKISNVFNGGLGPDPLLRAAPRYGSGRRKRSVSSALGSSRACARVRAAAPDPPTGTILTQPAPLPSRRSGSASLCPAPAAKGNLSGDIPAALQPGSLQGRHDQFRRWVSAAVVLQHRSQEQ